MQNEPIVIIGGGLAAASCAVQLREDGYEGKLGIVCAEDHLPYERPPLSKDYLQGNSELDDFTVKDEAWYAQHQVDLMLGVSATAIDRERQRVTLSDGGLLDYGQLVLATGATPRTADGLGGRDTPGVHLLRTIDDARSLRNSLLEGTRVAIIGAGWIGMEAAASARQQRAEVTVITPDQLPLAKVLGEDFGEHLKRLHAEAGVKFRTGTKIERVERRENELLLHAETWQAYADTVLVAIGAAPNLELARSAGLDTDHGVITDASLRTSDARILAIGDIAQAFNTTLRRQLRVEHWDNAIRQGKLAAATLLGRDDEYDWLPYFFTDQFELGMEYVGDRAPGDDEVVRGSMEDGEFILFWLREGRISAAMNVNTWDVNDTLRELVGRQVDPVRLADAAIDLPQLLED